MPPARARSGDAPPARGLPPLAVALCPRLRRRPAAFRSHLLPTVRPRLPSPRIQRAPNIGNLGGSEVYRLSPDGLAQNHVDIARRPGLCAGLRRTRAVCLRAPAIAARSMPSWHERDTDLAEASANQVTAFAPDPKGGLYAATSNLGKIFLLGPNPVARAPTKAMSSTPRISPSGDACKCAATAASSCFARSGNVDNPDRNWSPWKRSRSAERSSPSTRRLPASSSGRRCCSPASRMPVIDSVVVNYLPKNVAPEVDNVTVMVGCACAGGTRTSEPGSAASRLRAANSHGEGPHSIAVKWKAHDDNDDTLVYDVYYRGDGETRWKLLREDMLRAFRQSRLRPFPRRRLHHPRGRLGFAFAFRRGRADRRSHQLALRSGQHTSARRGA